MPDIQTPPEEPKVEDVGKKEYDFRLWRAQQAVRLGELALAEQEKSRDSQSKLAVSLMGWAVTITVLFLGAAIKSDQAAPLRLAAVAAALCSFTAALCCHWTFRMKDWKAPGMNPSYILQLGEMAEDGEETELTPYDTEMNVLDGIAKGYGMAYEHNEIILDAMSVRVRQAWTAFLTIPALALLVWAISFSAFYLTNLNFLHQNALNQPLV